MNNAAWNKDGAGYSMTTDSGIVVNLVKVGSRWQIVVDGVGFDLGRRASFDKAEALIASKGW